MWSLVIFNVLERFLIVVIGFPDTEGQREMSKNGLEYLSSCSAELCR